MACPVCDHTRHKVGVHDTHFWCPRCGTLGDTGQLPETPAIVGRVVDFLSALRDDHPRDRELIELAERLGLGESVRLS